MHLFIENDGILPKIEYTHASFHINHPHKIPSHSTHFFAVEKSSLN
jgi:hypothetical protein